MGLISALNTGRMALTTQRLAMEVTGNNIANAATEGFTRQRPRLVNEFSQEVQMGMYVGLGSKVGNLQRMVDEFLEVSLRDANSTAQGLNIRVRTFNRIETLLNELNDTDLSSLINDFFNSVDDCINNPGLIGNRVVMIERGNALARSLQEIRSNAVNEITLLNSQLIDSVTEINQLTKSLGGLNVQIMQAERGPQFKGAASELRDQRGRLLKQLSGFMNIRSYELPDGTVTVMAGSRALVMSSANYELGITPRVQGDVTVSDVVFEVDNRPVQFARGSLQGLIESRDQIVGGLIDDLNLLTGNLINEFNKVYSQGLGLQRFRDLTSVQRVLTPTSALNQAGLAFTPRNGSFEFKVVDEASQEITVYNISVDLDGIGADSSLQDIVDEINAEIGADFPEITASINPQNRMEISSSNDGVRFGFGTDSSGLLAALGINTFFTGSTAADISINAVIVANPQLLAGAMSLDAGDNVNFQALLGVRDMQMTGLQNLTIEGFYSMTVGALAVTSATASGAAESATVYLESLEADREGVSGVNLDEEAVNLIRFQGVYAASANYLSTLRDLIDILLQI